MARRACIIEGGRRHSSEIRFVMGRFSIWIYEERFVSNKNAFNFCIRKFYELKMVFVWIFARDILPSQSVSVFSPELVPGFAPGTGHGPAATGP